MSERGWMVVAVGLAGLLVALAALVCHVRALRDEVSEVRAMLVESNW